MAQVVWSRGLLVIFLAISITPIAIADRGKQQATLDAACEQARERRLAPERERFVNECVAKKQKPDGASCERFYSDYGARSGNRAPLYYDLPECIKAFEFRKSR